MQNKGFVKIFAIALTLVCLFYLSFTFKTRSIENKAAQSQDEQAYLDSVMNKLIPKLAHLMLYTALLDSIASEHAARMVAMQTATDNADELLRELNLQYNKSRQQAITSELLDIVGGTVNN